MLRKFPLILIPAFLCFYNYANGMTIDKDDPNNSNRCHTFKGNECRLDAFRCTESCICDCPQGPPFVAGSIYYDIVTCNFLRDRTTFCDNYEGRTCAGERPVQASFDCFDRCDRLKGENCETSH